VNLYLPSELTWSRSAGEVRVAQETGYPEIETSTLSFEMRQPAEFTLKLRVPAWSRDMSVKLNGVESGVACQPGNWAVLTRSWKSADKVEVRIPLHFRYQAVDRQHPKRVAIVRGPVVYALDFNYHDPAFELPDAEADLAKWLVPDGAPQVFRVARPDGRPVRLKFRPFYEFAEHFPYLMYFDLGTRAYALW
jgi:DUF1680 family protein